MLHLWVFPGTSLGRLFDVEVEEVLCVLILRITREKTGYLEIISCLILGSPWT
jgi:hypothetical protein